MKTGDIYPDRIDLHLYRGSKLMPAPWLTHVGLHAIEAGEPVDPDRPDDTPFYEETGACLYRSALMGNGSAGDSVTDGWVAINNDGNGEWSTAHDELDEALAKLPKAWLDDVIAEGFRRLGEVLA